MTKVIAARLHGQGKINYLDPQGFDLAPGVACVVQSEQGEEYAICSGCASEVSEDFLAKQPLLPVLRLASPEDQARYRKNLQLEEEAFVICKERVAAHALPMNLVKAEYVLDCSRLIFYFTADGRVDFRILVKDLASIFRTRIELRQIGVRDEACLMGGMGICGRSLCCATFLQNFQPVSIKMAKEQNLSMNPAKISGCCGRLLCCLKYEEDAYKDAIKRLPARGDRVSTAQGKGVVVDVNLLKETLKVCLDKDESEPVILPATEVKVLPARGPRKPLDKGEDDA